jgi:hypothetical protein
LTDQPPMTEAHEQGRVYGTNLPTWYSQLQKTIYVRMPAKASPEQVKNIVTGQDVKKEEVEWSGILEWLGEQKETVTKNQVMDFLKANEIKVEETVHGGVAFEGWTEDDIRQHYRDVFGDDTGLSLEEVKRGIGESESFEPEGTKFDSYTLPGGENYRELLLTLPSQTAKPELKTTHGGWSWFVGDKRVGDLYPNREAALEEHSGTVEMIRRKAGLDFHSSHFSEPNVLAHVRFNERIAAEGKRVLFIEEIQSDWHQKGREKGYAKDTKGWTAKSLSGPDAGFNRWQINDATGNFVTEIVGGSEESAMRKAAEGIPDAPFKKTWHELALKRMLRWATDNGFDRIAWTTGEQQAERYDLSKQVSKVVLTKRKADGTTLLTAWDNNANQVISRDVNNQNDIAGLVGKELAAKFEAMAWDEHGTEKVLKGLDLKVGGEGMKGFYDQIIPSFLNKYTKKWGGRVTQTNIDVTTEPIQRWYVRRIGTDAPQRYAVTREDGEIDQIFEGTGSERQAYGRVKELNGPPEAARAAVHALDITPDMKRSVTETGQPLFERSLNLFGVPDSDVLAKPQKADPDQPDLFSHVARPQFEVPLSAFKSQQPEKPVPRAKQPPFPDDSFHQVRAREVNIPGALMETAVVDRLVDDGYLKMDRRKVESPSDVAALFHFLKEDIVENVYAVGLDADGNVLGVRHAGMGRIDQVAADPRSILTPMRLLGAKQVVIVHNHPSGDPSPSVDDVEMTKSYRTVAKMLGMQLPFHVVIDGDKFGLIDGDLKTSTPPAPPAPTGEVRVPIVKPLQTGKAAGPMITTPAAVEAYVKGFLSQKGGLVALAMDVHNRVSGTWLIAEKDLNVVVPRLTDIVLRNNAAAVILATDARMPAETVQQIRKALTLTTGANMLDFVRVTPSGYQSYSEQGHLREERSPYSFGETKGGYGDETPEGVTPGQNASDKRLFNRRKIQVEILRAEVGIKEEDWLKMKLDLVGKASMAEMTIPELEKLSAELRAMKKGRRSTPAKAKKSTSDPESVRKDLSISDAAYREIRLRLFGEEGAHRPLNEEQKAAVIEKMKEYPVDVRRKAILWDMPNASGAQLDKTFAFEAGHYHDLTSYQRTYLETWRAFKLIDPSGHFKKLTFDKMERAVEEEMRMVESIRLRMAGVVGDIKPGSEESARIMRFGEGRFGTQYVLELRAKKLHYEFTLKTGRQDGKEISAEHRTALKDALKHLEKEIKAANEFDPAQVTEKEKNIDTYLRGLYDELLDWQNQVRKKYRKVLIPRRQYYYTHIWEQNLLDQILGGPQADQKKTLPEADYTKPYAPFNPYELARQGGTGYKEDAIGVFDVYLNTAAREALYRPVIAEIRQYVKHLPGRSAQAVDRWLNDMAGKTTFIDRASLIPEGFQRYALRLSRRAKGNLLVGNLNFIMTNMMNFSTTMGDTGPLHTLQGIVQFANPHWRNFAWAKCRLLQSRTNIFELDYSRHKALVRVLSGNFIEYFNVGSAFLAGYFKGKSVGLSEMDAIRFGNDSARRTQADYRKHAVSPYMRSRVGQILAMMQTYTFNLFHTLQYDYLRAPAPDPSLSHGGNALLGRKTKRAKMGHIVSLLMGVMAANWLKNRLTGRPAYDIRAWMPNYMWMPSWLIAGFAGEKPSREFNDPLFYKPLTMATLMGRAAITGKESDKKQATRALTDMAVLVLPGYGGIQLKRMLLDHTLFPPPLKGSSKAPAGRRIVPRQGASR